MQRGVWMGDAEQRVGDSVPSLHLLPLCHLVSISPDISPLHVLMCRVAAKPISRLHSFAAPLSSRV